MEPKVCVFLQQLFFETLDDFKNLFLTFLSDAIPSADQIRITPSLKSQRGSVWTKSKSIFEYWEIEVTFRVTGRGRVGADGLVGRMVAFADKSVV